MPLLEIDDVHVRRGLSTVIRGMSIGVDEGEVVTLLGSNGVGKSTTLRTISGLHKPFRGTIRFAGTEISGRSSHEIVRSGVAHVPEGRQVFPGLSVRENLEMGAYATVGKSAAPIDRALEVFPALERFMGSPAGSLSGGQQQMLAFARGLMSTPRLLLLDEPSLGLAPQIVAEIGRLIGRLRGEGVTILLVEQNAALALGVADRGYVVVDGAIALAGSADELSTDPMVRQAYLGI